MPRWLPVLVLVAGCQRTPQPEAAPEEDPPGTEVRPDMATDVPEEAERPSERVAAVEPTSDRACGEPGEAPTTLPSGLAKGRTAIGATVLKPGERGRIGPVDVHYDEHAWFGTRSAGHRAPAIEVTIDRTAWPVEGPYGKRERITDGGMRSFDLGGLHFEGEALAEGLRVRVSSEACPPHRSDQAPGERTWFWLDSHNPVSQSFALGADVGDRIETRLQLDRPEAPLQLFVSGPATWMYPLSLHPEALPAAHALGWGFFVEEIVPHDGARHHGGGWASTGTDVPKVSVRLRLEKTPSPPLARSTATTESSCGRPTEGRLDTVPAELEAPASHVGAAKLRVGSKRRIGPLDVDYRREDTVVERGWRQTRTSTRWIVEITREGTPVANIPLVSHDATTLHTRAGRYAIALRPVGAKERLDAVDVEISELVCDAELQGVVATGPLELWLSTRGARSVTLREGQDMLGASLNIHGTDIALGLSDGRSSLSVARVGPALGGTVVDLHGRRAMIMKVESGPQTRWNDDRWHSDAPEGPGVHVHLVLGEHGER